VGPFQGINAELVQKHDSHPVKASLAGGWLSPEPHDWTTRAMRLLFRAFEDGAYDM
jgi:hypothetical protein